MDKLSQATTTLLVRGKNLILVIVYALACLVTMLYGVVFTVNLLTQLHFVSDWIYLTVACCCYALLTGLIYVLIRRMIKAFKQAFSVG